MKKCSKQIANVISWLLLASALYAQPAKPKRLENCQPTSSFTVAGGAFIVQNDEWSSTARMCIVSDGSASYEVTVSDINNKSGMPGAFPSLFQGCHWGWCTRVNPFPIQVAKLKKEAVTWRATAAPGVWDQTFDLWFATKPVLPDAPDGAELMVLLREAPGQGHAGKKIGSVTIHRRKYDIWFSPAAETRVNSVSYVSTTPQASVKNFDLRMFIVDATRRGFIDPKWYQLSVEAGFEIWQGGAGLKTNSFAVDVK